MLAAAGYPDGFAVTLDCPNDRYINDEAICRAAAAMLGEIGIRVTVAARPMREHFPMIKNRETDFYMLGWGTGTLQFALSTSAISSAVMRPITRPATPIRASTT